MSEHFEYFDARAFRRARVRRERVRAILRYLAVLLFCGVLMIDLDVNASEIWDAGETQLPKRESAESVAQIGNAIEAEIVREVIVQTVYVDVPTPRACPAEDEVLVPTDFPSGNYECRNFDDLVMKYLEERASGWDHGLEILLSELRIVPDMELLLNLLGASS